MNSERKRELLQIAELFQTHVTPDRGITNSFLTDLASHLSLSSFRGVFAADEIPRKLIREERPFSIIVNLAKRRPSSSSPFSNTGHFVCLRVEENFVLYIDSFAMGCWQENVCRFLGEMNVPVFSNTTLIQHPKSMYCGLFAMLFCLLFDMQEKGLKTTRFNFDSKNLKRNDSLCISYFKDMIQ